MKDSEKLRREAREKSVELRSQEQVARRNAERALNIAPEAMAQLIRFFDARAARFRYERGVISQMQDLQADEAGDEVLDDFYRYGHDE